MYVCVLRTYETVMTFTSTVKGAFNEFLRDLRQPTSQLSIIPVPEPESIPSSWAARSMSAGGDAPTLSADDHPPTPLKSKDPAA